MQVTLLNVQEKLEKSDGEGHATSEDWYDESDLPLSVEKLKGFFNDTNIAVETQRKHADPAEAIINVSEEIGADRIIMSGRKRTPTGKVLFGSVSQSVLLNSSIPVTLIME
ncbi:universal stress protein [Halostagnicola sp. A56]|uniref:universal stress protein n=1 Tax=Halostagnicola sp. A56 TaxID=1495067 RepID=UPI0009E21B11